MPLGDVGELPPADQGDLPPDSPPLPTIQAIQDASSLSALLARCAAASPPADCPRGLVGTIVLASAGTSGAGPPVTMPILYVTAIGPGMYRVIFEPPPETSSEVWVWVDGANAPTVTPADRALLDGRPVAVATFTVSDPTATFRLAARATGNGVDATSPVIKVVPSVR
jgi:hypothetical protein